jgi:hypothetical protein
MGAGSGSFTSRVALTASVDTLFLNSLDEPGRSAGGRSSRFLDERFEMLLPRDGGASPLLDGLESILLSSERDWLFKGGIDPEPDVPGRSDSRAMSKAGLEIAP